MYYFLIPLLIGFACNIASAFTTAFTRRWGEVRGRKLTYTLRNFLGIPLWALGLGLAVRLNAPLLFTPTLVIKFLDWLFIAAGAALIWAALLALGWRAAARRPAIRSRVVAYTAAFATRYTAVFSWSSLASFYSIPRYRCC